MPTKLSIRFTAGVAAPTVGPLGKMPQGMLTRTVVSQPCPLSRFDRVGPVHGSPYARAARFNGFFGHGRVDALNAVTGASGN